MAINNDVNITLTAKDKASKGFQKVEKSASGLGKKLKGLGGPLKTIGIGLAGAGVAAGAVGVKMFNLADNIETTLGKAQTVFGDYFDDMDQFGKETAKAMGLSRNEFLKTAAGMQDLLVPMGFTRQEAAEMTKETIGLAGALSEWSAGQYSAEEAANILTKAMLGEKEQLKAMGINVDISSKAFQERIKIIQEDTGKTLEQAKALDISRQIMEKSTDAQNAYANGADSLTRKKAEMTATLKNVQETIATALIPAFHEIINTLAPMIEKVAESTKAWFENEQNVTKLTESIRTVIQVLGFMKDTVGFIIDVIYMFGQAIGFVAADVTIKLMGLWEAFKELGAGIVEVWNGVKEATIETFDAILSYVTGIIDSIVSKFTAAFDKIKSIMNKIKEFGGAVSGAVSGAISSAKETLTGTRANGGPVSAGSAYMVGERGSEVFVPKTDGTIVPNGGFGGSVVINMGGITVTDEADENRLVQKIKESMTDDLQMFSNFGIS